MSLTRKQIIEFPCIVCNAAPGEGCTENAFGAGEALLVTGFHRERANLAERFPQFPTEEELSATDKALICYYTVIIMADSVSAHSARMMGKQFTSVEIQKFFCRKAIEELRKDGLLPEAKKRNTTTALAIV